MRRFITLILLITVIHGVVSAQQMTDNQVIEYVKQAQSMGKSQSQIVSELMRRGVTREQAERIQKEYEASQTAAPEATTAPFSRSRQDFTPTAQPTGEMVGDSLQHSSPFPYPPIEKQIFGHNIFNNPYLTFEPNANNPTSKDYRLGPGDEVIIDIWGASENTIRQEISPEGNIIVSNLGPVYLAGMTVREANSYLQREFSKIYSGISGNTPSSQIQLTLGNIRSIQINVMGEVRVPGTYIVSSFATVFHALYSAGGVNRIGSLRNIQVIRNGKPLTTIDVYGYILNGKMQDDIRLMEDDLIIVPPYQNLVHIEGKVKRPMFYEMKSDESVGALIEYSGGFTGDAYTKNVRLIRKTGREYQIYNIEDAGLTAFYLQDGDELQVDSVLNRFENRIELRGAVYRPGSYQLGNTVHTIKQLIDRADGIRGDAFLNRSILQREKEDFTLEVVQVDLRGILNGTADDILLRKNDVLYIPSIHDLQEEMTLTIHGEVAYPGTYAFAANMTLEDIIIQAGGLLEAASTVRVEVARRIKDPQNSEISRNIGETYSFTLKNGFVVDGRIGFVLQPFDEVYVRKSPAYQTQRNVTVSGEVLFNGSYALTHKNERLTDIIRKAGGVTPDAYVQGARLTRQMNEDEKARQQATLRMAEQGRDSISIEKLDTDFSYHIGIELDKALRYPGSDYDIVLREGDQIEVPEYVNTVKINGAVMHPNTVSYKKKADVRYYINQAGGYGARAKKNRVYIVYMNGTVSRLKKWNSSKVQPGSEIIVPLKPERKGMSVAEATSVATASTSIATMVATMVNLFK